MNSTVLKILACVFMVSDHVGQNFFPHIYVMRLIGRLAFPLFAFLIAEGYRHSRDLPTYFGRLILFALISQPILNWLLQPPVPLLNIFFTLVLGLCSIHAYEKNKSLLWPVMAMLAAEIANAEFWYPGVLLIFAFHYTYGDWKKTLFYPGIVLLVMLPLRKLIYDLITIPGFIASLTSIIKYDPVVIMQPFGLLSLVLIHFYNHQRGVEIKYFFYLFYPVHLFILAVFKRCF